MNVLALDGALGEFSAAVSSGGSIAGARAQSGGVALERGLTIVDDLLRQTGIAPQQIDRLAVGVGPGGFTGLRIAIAYAKSLAAVWKRPLVPIDSFDLLEYGARFERVLAVVVGRPGVVSARFRVRDASRRASGTTRQVLEALSPLDAEAGAQAPLAVIGAPKDVLDALGERGLLVRAFDPAVTPAAAAAALAASSLAPASSPHAVRADYGELPAAKPPRF